MTDFNCKKRENTTVKTFYMAVSFCKIYREKT